MKTFGLLLVLTWAGGPALSRQSHYDNGCPAPALAAGAGTMLYGP
jgi:hypothetical protein